MFYDQNRDEVNEKLQLAVDAQERAKMSKVDQSEVRIKAEPED